MSRLHRRVNDVRTHHLHCLTTRLAKTHGRIVVEGLDNEAQGLLEFGPNPLPAGVSVPGTGATTLEIQINNGPIQSAPDAGIDTGGLGGSILALSDGFLFRLFGVQSPYSTGVGGVIPGLQSISAQLAAGITPA
jgi:hypothetical protein